MPIKMLLCKRNFAKLTWEHFHRITGLGHSLCIYTLLNISAGGRESMGTSPLRENSGRWWKALGEQGPGAGCRRTLSCQNQRDVQMA